MFSQLTDAWQLLRELYPRTDSLIVQLPTAGFTGRILPLAVSCFPVFWNGLVWLPALLEIQRSQEDSQPLRSPSGPSQGWAHSYQGPFWQPECTPFQAGMFWESLHNTSSDFSRCPASFKRDCYQCYTTPVVTMLENVNFLLYQGVAPAVRASLSITDLLMRLHLLTVQIRLCSHDAHREVLFSCRYTSETRLTESNPLPHKICMLFWKSKCK